MNLKRTILLLIIVIFSSLKCYSKNIYNSDSLIVIKYKEKTGIFLDSINTIKVLKKIVLTDSLIKINNLNLEIISRMKQVRNNNVLLEKSFNNYILNTEKRRNLENQIYNNNLNKKKFEIWIYRSAITLSVFKYLILPLVK